MSTAAEPNASTSYEDLIRIYRENAALSTFDECRRALSALRQLALIEPSEAEFSGERITKRDIEARITEASQQLSFFQPPTPTTGRVPVIVPGRFY